MEIDGTGYSNGRMFLANGDLLKTLTYRLNNFSWRQLPIEKSQTGATALKQAIGQIEVLAGGGELDIRTGGTTNLVLSPLAAAEQISTVLKAVISNYYRNQRAQSSTWYCYRYSGCNKSAEKHLGSKYGSEVNLWSCRYKSRS
ncbi:MAG: hypothetical protein ACLR2G_11745 [Phascolarctobacterium faecium]